MPYTGQNPTMSVGRQAVSIDERRCYFRSNLWGPALPHQNIKQVWFAGVHSDVGGSYAYPECGLSQISLEWMLCEAVSFGLIVDAKKAEHALGRIPPSPPVAPDPRGILHNSLTFWWWLIEFLPHSYFDSATKKVKWRIPLGARRFIPQDSVLHSTVQQKLRKRWFLTVLKQPIMLLSALDHRIRPANTDDRLQMAVTILLRPGAERYS